VPHSIEVELHMAIAIPIATWSVRDRATPTPFMGQGGRLHAAIAIATATDNRQTDTRR